MRTEGRGEEKGRDGEGKGRKRGGERKGEGRKKRGRGVGKGRERGGEIGWLLASSLSVTLWQSYTSYYTLCLKKRDPDIIDCNF